MKDKTLPISIISGFIVMLLIIFFLMKSFLSNKTETIVETPKEEVSSMVADDEFKDMKEIKLKSLKFSKGKATTTVLLPYLNTGGFINRFNKDETIMEEYDNLGNTNQFSSSAVSWIRHFKFTFIGDSYVKGLDEALSTYITSDSSNNSLPNAIYKISGNAKLNDDGINMLKEAEFNRHLHENLILSFGVDGGFNKEDLEAFMKEVPSTVKRIVFITQKSNEPLYDIMHSEIRQLAKSDKRVAFLNWNKHAKLWGWKLDNTQEDGVHLKDVEGLGKFIMQGLYELYVERSIPEVNPKTFKNTDWHSYIADLENMNVRMKEPLFITKEYVLKVLKERFPSSDHQIINSEFVDKLFEVSEKHKLNMGIILGHIHRVSKMGLAPCYNTEIKEAQAPYNIGCVQWPNSYKAESPEEETWLKEYNVRPTKVKHDDRFWADPSNVLVGLEITAKELDDIAKQSDGTFKDFVEKYKENYHILTDKNDSFMEHIFNMMVILLEQDITNTELK